jgi:hypothetical protein
VPPTTNIVVVMLDDVGFGQFSCSVAMYRRQTSEESPPRDFGQPLPYGRHLLTTRRTAHRTEPASGRLRNVAELATGHDGYTGYLPCTATVARYTAEWIRYSMF